MRADRSTPIRWLLGVTTVVALALGGCAPTDQRAQADDLPSAESPTTATELILPTTLPPLPAADGTAAPPVTATPAPENPPQQVDVRAVLAPLVIVDGPGAGGYVRELFPHWRDTDGDGCDGREQALIAASLPAAVVLDNCRVAGGTWFSDYDGRTFTAPGDLDVDHIVPLADAWRSGASGWSTDERARFANDQRNLWPVSASTNRSKRDASPDEWRPPRRESWCRYAGRWVETKIAYRLTATTPERDALGTMLELCNAETPTAPPPTPAPAPAPAPTPTPTPAPPPPVTPPTTVAPPAGEPYYTNCAAARAAGAAPIRRGEPGYRPALDGDDDGIACE